MAHPVKISSVVIVSKVETDVEQDLRASICNIDPTSFRCQMAETRFETHFCVNVDIGIDIVLTSIKDRH